MKIDYEVESKDGVYVKTFITIPRNEFQKEYDNILKEEAKNTEVQGFRKGQVPTDMLDSQVKQKAAVQALDKLTPLYVGGVVEQEKLEIIAPPQYVDFPDLQKEEGDLNLKVKFTIFPQIKLGDFKKIKISQEETKPTQEEVDNTVEEMFQRSESENKGEKPTDKWAKEIGEQYQLEGVKGLKTLKEEITKLLEKEKERINKQNQESEILKQAIELSKIEIPQEATDFEAQERERTFLEELKNANMSADDFCQSRGTDFEQLRESWKKDAKEALEGEILLRTYARENDIEATEDEIKKKIEEVKQSQEEVPEDLENNPRWRDNIINVIKKQKSYEKLISEVLG